jgi:hypothetical protein
LEIVWNIQSQETETEEAARETKNSQGSRFHSMMLETAKMVLPKHQLTSTAIITNKK